MASLSVAQLTQLASNAGFSGSALSTAVAIALAESSGNPSVVGDTSITPGGSVGLMQINLAAHPEYNAASLLDPQTNMDAAFQVYQQAGGFSPWTTFNTGAYATYLPSTALALPSIDDLGEEELGLSDALGSIDPNLLIIGGVLAAGLALLWLEA